MNPEAAAPARPDRSWEPSAEATATLPAATDAAAEADRTLDLPALVDVALAANPDTRDAWQASRAAAARYGGALEPYFPRVFAAAVVSPNERVLFQDTPDTLVIHQDSYVPEIALTYTLLDFGRRASAAEVARERLVAANFSFNRSLQRVVFEVEAAFFVLDAAIALETAAQQNVELARKVREAADRRLSVGLATRPDALLAQQVETRALYELESSRAAFRDAQAHLARTLGRPANRAPRIEPIATRPVPADLASNVDALLENALADRPDLAARAAEVRASAAEVERTQAEFWPRVGFEGRYAEDFWDYTVQGSARVRNSEPAYSTVFRLDWDVFRGFGRENALRAARADSERAASELEASRLDASVEVWSAYYDQLAARKKLAYAETLLKSSQDTYDATSRSYAMGLSDVVALLTAERDLATARYTLVRSRADVLISAARLAYAVGSAAPGR